MRQNKQQGKSHKQGGSRSRVEREQPRKDSREKRVNFDNERVDKIKAAIKEMDNAVQWYKRNPEMASAAARIGFSHTTGAPYKFRGKAVFVPGVMAFHFRTGLGDIQAVNQAKDSTYSYTVHGNSRNTSYTSADQFMFIYAGKEVFMALAHGIRAYGVMTKYEQENAYLPKALLAAMGFNPTDLQSNYYRMLFDLNQLIAQAKQIWIPNEIPVIEREFWMCSHIYMDGESEKSQFYMYVPANFYTIQETSSTSGTSLAASTAWNIEAGNYTWAQYVSMVQGLIQALVDSEDRGVIFGDILKAYGAERIYRVNEIDTSYEVTPVYDEEVLAQMSNITAAFWPNVPQITQDPNNGTVAYNSQGMAAPVANVNRLFPEQTLLNYHGKGQPSEDWVLVASRMTTVTNSVTAATGSDFNVFPGTSATEYCTNMTVYQFSTTSTAAFTKTQFKSLWSTSAAPTFDALCAYSMFDWAPPLYMTDGNLPTTATPATRPGITNVFSDLENAVLLDSSELARLHNACVYSEWGVPISLNG